VTVGVHDYHEGLPGYHPEQILHDGCAECETRGKNVAYAIGSLDKHRFALAWRRAADRNRTAGVRDFSQAERPLLEVLWAVQLGLEPRGIPIGEVPYGILSERSR
jgi:hypothetical protein